MSNENLEQKYSILLQSFQRLQRDYRKLEAENDRLQELVWDQITDEEPLLTKTHGRRPSSDLGECEHCGKFFKSLEAKLRHQRRSKVCQHIQKLPILSGDAVEEAERCLHGIVIKENEKSEQVHCK